MWLDRSKYLYFFPLFDYDLVLSIQSWEWEGILSRNSESIHFIKHSEKQKSARGANQTSCVPPLLVCSNLDSNPSGQHPHPLLEGQSISIILKINRGIARNQSHFLFLEKISCLMSKLKQGIHVLFLYKQFLEKFSKKSGVTIFRIH